MRIYGINNNYNTYSQSFGAKTLMQKAVERDYTEDTFNREHEKLYKKKQSSAKFLTPIKLFFNKDYKELKKNEEFKEVDFKKILTDLKFDREYNLALGSKQIESNKMGGILVDYIGRPPKAIPMGDIEEYDYSKTDLGDYARILNDYVKDSSISKEEKMSKLSALSTVGELVFNIERR